MPNQRLKLFVTCPAGLEELLQEELRSLGLQSTKLTVTGVMCEADILLSYKICLWSRLANRVLLVLESAKSGNSDELYNAVSNIDWGEHIGEAESIRVDFAGQNDAIRHTLYGARVVKDAIVDQFLSRGLERPDVDLNNPDHRINVRLTPKSFYVALDLSGESLHKRNYRLAKGSAPIKENLAAALLFRARWPEQAKQGAGFIDPMCGSGTFLIESAMIAADVAPGLMRCEFGFMRWLKHDPELWAELLSEAGLRKERGIRSIRNQFYGCELDQSVAAQAEENIKRAGLSSLCSIHNGQLSESDFATDASQASGLVMVNPPYGMRLGEKERLSEDYQVLANECKRRFSGWRMGILSSDKTLLAETKLRYDKRYKIYNGAIECEFRTYSLFDSKTELREKPPRREAVLSEGAQMVANRVNKNLRKLKSWRDKNQVSCFRVYDADLPEYAAAIDVYGESLHIQEYQAPRTIDENKARRRLEELIAATTSVFEVEPIELNVKTRRRNRGSAQYQKYSDLDQSEFQEVREGPANLLVNLKSYLDTGLFLDHRPLRRKIFSEAAGRSFLNLFSYTSTATVHAVLGGATETTSVDMSNTYVSWSKMNFERNNIRSSRHEIIRSDVMEWLAKCRRGYDLIMLDPPSFSNSKKMDASFDVQRDHTALISRCMELLKPGGTLYFSNNLRSFKLDPSLQEKFSVKDISAETIDMDFKRNNKIHSCFDIQH